MDADSPRTVTPAVSVSPADSDDYVSVPLTAAHAAMISDALGNVANALGARERAWKRPFLGDVPMPSDLLEAIQLARARREALRAYLSAYFEGART